MKTMPEKPLKILTIDGGGLQAISSLLILDKLLDTIAKTNKVPHRKPRPCDVFDTIAGIGAGGWLALLLGRFHMDITTCLSEWYKITDRIAPQSKPEELRMRAFHHCYYNPERLLEQIDSLTRVYGTGKYLFDNRAGEVRTRHVFVAALRSDASGYNLFRSYKIPEDAAMSHKLLEGPENPSQYEILRAFGVTGAAKYFSPPWNEQMSKSGRTFFNDSKYPKPHNITELALDEMWGLYGKEVPLSVIVNIGPGLPSKSDVKQIAQRFSWGLSPSSSLDAKRPRSPTPGEEEEERKKRTHLESPELEKANSTPTARDLSVRFPQNVIDQGLNRTTGDKKQQLARSNIFGSIKDRTVAKKLRRRETEIEQDIKKKLNAIYQGGGELYYRLAPDHAPQGTARNDSSAPGVTLDATLRFLKQPVIEIKIDEIVQKMPEVMSTA
ncbi:FabD/lysophospholipase-like protein [Hyaloscypha variabilis]